MMGIGKGIRYLNPRTFKGTETRKNTPNISTHIGTQKRTHTPHTNKK